MFNSYVAVRDSPYSLAQILKDHPSDSSLKIQSPQDAAGVKKKVSPVASFWERHAVQRPVALHCPAKNGDGHRTPIAIFELT